MIQTDSLSKTVNRHREFDLHNYSQIFIQYCVSRQSDIHEPFYMDVHCVGQFEVWAEWIKGSLIRNIHYDRSLLQLRHEMITGTWQSVHKCLLPYLFG